MTSVKESIPIFFAADNGYVPFLSVALHSLLENASQDYVYQIIVLSQDISEENQARLRGLAGENADLRFVPMAGQIHGITDRFSNRLRCDYFTMTIYYRLFIPVMFPEYDKGIYLDGDIVVPGDISELYCHELGDHLIGACRDLSVLHIPEMMDYMDNGVGVGRTKYINSGVLLMNLKALREAELDRRFLELLTTYHFSTIAPDQDYLNVLCKDKILYLDECWNAMPNEHRTPLQAPKLIHYNLYRKPWCYESVPYGAYFWKYAPGSGFLKEILDYQRSYTDENRRSDDQCLNTLLRTASEIAKSDYNFRTVLLSGKDGDLS